MIKKLSILGEVAIVDLDATLRVPCASGAVDPATGKVRLKSNKEVIKKLCAKYKCRVGGGIRDAALATEYLNAGAQKIIIGTAANRFTVSNASSYLVFRLLF